MKKQSRLGLILLLAAIVAWFGVINPQIKNFNKNAVQVKVLSTEEKSYEQRIADLDKIRSTSGVSSTLTALFLAMPKTSQVPEVLVMIQGLGANSGVVFTDVNVGTPDSNQVPVSLSFSGSQGAVNAFLDAVNKNIRTAVIKGQSVAADQNGNLNISLQLGLIYQGGPNANQ